MAKHTSMQGERNEDSNGSGVRKRKRCNDNKGFLNDGEETGVSNDVAIEYREVIAYEHEYWMTDPYGNRSRVTTVNMMDWDEFSDFQAERDGVGCVVQIASHPLIRANDFEIAVNEVTEE